MAAILDMAAILEKITKKKKNWKITNKDLHHQIFFKKLYFFVWPYTSITWFLYLLSFCRVRFHVAQSFLYMIYRFSGYLLMLAAMTYNMYIFLAVVVGLGVGYFFLAPIRQPEASATYMEDSHARGSRHRSGRGSGPLNESGTHGYAYGSLWEVTGNCNLTSWNYLCLLFTWTESIKHYRGWCWLEYGTVTSSL